jgi:hypothetical protein
MLFDLIGETFQCIEKAVSPAIDGGHLITAHMAPIRRTERENHRISSQIAQRQIVFGLRRSAKMRQSKFPAPNFGPFRASTLPLFAPVLPKIT